MTLLKEILERSGLNQTELVKHVDIPQYRLSLIANGHKATNPEKQIKRT